MANLSSLFTAWLSSHPNRMDYSGRERLGESHQIEEYVGKGAKVLKKYVKRVTFLVEDEGFSLDLITFIMYIKAI